MSSVLHLFRVRANPSAATHFPGTLSYAVAISFLVLLFCCLDPARGVQLEVTAHSKCIGEELQQGVMVVGNYHIVGEAEGDSQGVAVRVMSPHGRQLHFQEKVHEGHFGFTSQEEGQFLICLWASDAKAHSKPVQVELDLRTGVAAQDWGDIAKKDKLDDIGLELRKLDEAVKGIRNEMNYFHKKEAEMRNLNELTNARVAWIGILSLLACISLSGLQLWYLKAYFVRKKLL